MTWNAPSFLDDAARAAWPDAAPLWRLLSVGGGESVLQAGQRGGGLGVVVEGTLRIQAFGVEPVVAGPGDLVGEVTAFFANASPLESIRSAGPAKLWVLDAQALRLLRTQKSPVYAALLDAALRGVVRRLGVASQRIEALRPGTMPVPKPEPPGLLGRLWGALSRPARNPCPPILPLLREHPGMKKVSQATLDPIVAAFHAAPIDPGQVVAEEGSKADCCWILAAGQIDVVRAGAGDQASHLASLLPGQIFGINALVEETTRTAACVATASGWVYRMDRSAFRGLTGDARIAWHEAVLVTLVGQLYRNNALIRRLVSPLDAAPGLDAPPEFLTHRDVQAASVEWEPGR
jgi:CRP-like cAMP-binding protein